MTPISDVHIDGTEGDPAITAELAIREDTDRLLLAFQAKVALLVELHLDGATRDAARAGLVDFTTGTLRDHLAATDRVLYAAAAGAQPTRLLVRALRSQHRIIARYVDQVATAADSERTAQAAGALRAVLASWQEMEREVLLPALAELPGADLPTLAADLRTLLHGGAIDQPAVLDVREIPHGQRHPRIFGRYAGLTPGEGFVLVNNHDPKPLRKEFAATHPGEFTWDYLESGPQQWRIRIGRPAVPA